MFQQIAVAVGALGPGSPRPPPRRGRRIVTGGRFDLRNRPAGSALAGFVPRAKRPGAGRRSPSPAAGGGTDRRTPRTDDQGPSTTAPTTIAFDRPILPPCNLGPDRNAGAPACLPILLPCHLAVLARPSTPPGGAGGGRSRRGRSPGCPRSSTRPAGTPAGVDLERASVGVDRLREQAIAGLVVAASPLISSTVPRLFSVIAQSRGLAPRADLQGLAEGRSRLGQKLVPGRSVGAAPLIGEHGAEVVLRHRPVARRLVARGDLDGLPEGGGCLGQQLVAGLALEAPPRRRGRCRGWPRSPPNRAGAFRGSGPPAPACRHRPPGRATSRSSPLGADPLLVERAGQTVLRSGPLLGRLVAGSNLERRL